MAQLYVEAAFSAQAKKRCEEMVDHLLSAMGQAIRGVEWMTETTRAEALRKLDGFIFHSIIYLGKGIVSYHYPYLCINIERRIREAKF